MKSESSQAFSAHEHIYSYDDCSLEPTSPCLYFAKALPPGRSIRGSLFLGVSKGCLCLSTQQSTLLGVTLNSGHCSIPKGIPSRHPYGTSIYCALQWYHCTLTGCTYETWDLFSVIIYRLVLKKYKALFLVLYCAKWVPRQPSQYLTEFLMRQLFHVLFRFLCYLWDTGVNINWGCLGDNVNEDSML